MVRSRVMPAAKANWILAIQRIIAEEGCGCDVYSGGELTAALQAGFDPDYISVNGVPKDEDHIYRSIRERVRLTIDSLEEVDVIEKSGPGPEYHGQGPFEAQAGDERIHQGQRFHGRGSFAHGHCGSGVQGRSSPLNRSWPSAQG